MINDDLQKLLWAAVAGSVLGFAGFVAGGGDVQDLSPVALSPAESRCPEGWKDTSEEADHAIVLKCEKGDWIVYLREGGTFSHALQKNTPGAQFIFDPKEVPGWLPASSSQPP